MSRFIDSGGYLSELERARQQFAKDAVLTVLTVSIGDWMSYYSFEECNGQYNTVMFEPVAQTQSGDNEALVHQAFVEGAATGARAMSALRSSVGEE